MSGAATDQPVAPDDALDRYRLERFREARRAGLTRVESVRFATGPATLRELRKLRADGCDPATMARIVC